MPNARIRASINPHTPRKGNATLVIFAIFSWLGLSSVIYFLTPEDILAIILFTLIFFFAVYFTSALFLSNKRRGLIISVSLTLFLILRLLNLGNILNLILIIGIAASVELYLSKFSKG